MNIKAELARAHRAAPLTELDIHAIHRRLERQSRARRLRTALVALVIGVLGVGGVVSSFGGLRSADRLPASGFDLGLPEGSFYYEYVVTYNLIPGAGPDVERESTEMWLAPDGAGRFAAEGHIRNYPLYVVDERPADVTFDSGESPWEWVDLPEEAEPLREALLDRTTDDGASPAPPVPSPSGEPVLDQDSWRLINTSQGLLERFPLYLPPPERRALFGVLRETGVFEVRAGVEDPLGRPATELSIVLEEIRLRWYVDERSGQWLARVVEDPRTEEVLTAELMVRQGITASVDSRELMRSFVPPAAKDEPAFT